MTELVDAKNLIWGVKREIGLCMSFPTVGEPRNKYYEQNRANRIAYINSKYEDGWRPDAPDGWWVFRVKTSSEPVEPPVFYVRDRATGDNVLCTLDSEGRIIRKMEE